jgi:hypothetical protein
MWPASLRSRPTVKAPKRMHFWRRYLLEMTLSRISVTLLSLLFAFALAAPTASARPAFFDGNSSDGQYAVFTTEDQLVPGDTDQEKDVYVRSFNSDLAEYVTREASVGPTGGNDTLPARYDGMSALGTEIFFSTAEPMVPEDIDQQEDIYLRDIISNETTLVSRGSESCAALGCGNGDDGAGFSAGGVAAAGGVVFFTTAESLSNLDTDGGQDVYAREIEAEETLLVSAGDGTCTIGDCGNGSEGVSFRGIDETGTKAFFTTSESLSSQDEDLEVDIYERDLATETTHLVSLAGICPAVLPAGQSCKPSYGGISLDGSHAFFETGERLSGQDTDSAQDVYGWSGSGTPTLVSIGPDGGNGGKIARYAGSSGNGTAVYFETDEQLDTGADSDQVGDVYRNREGTTALVSAGEGGRGNGPFLASLDEVPREGLADRAFFSTSESLVAADTDAKQDVYERLGGVTTLVSTGAEASGGASDASFAGASGDGSKVFFATVERLVPQDTDTSLDIYMRSGSATVLVSVGQINGNGPYPAGLHGVSSAGAIAFFTTQERLTEGDGDSDVDVYSWNGTNTLLVSAANASFLSLGPPPPTLEGTSPTSPNPSTTPTIFGKASAGALVRVYRTTNCTGAVVAQGTATELGSPGLTVTAPVTAGSTTFFSANAESQGNPSVCSSAISYRQEDAPQPPPTGEEGSGGATGAGGGGAGSGSSTGGSTGGSKIGPGASAGGGGKHGTTYVTPLPRITFGPAYKTRLRRPTFRFLDSTGQPDTHFFCRVDKLHWAQCASPAKLKKLKLGRHVFSVKAVNAVGTAGASPIKRAFKVVAR